MTIINGVSDANRIDGYATLGLTGVHNSLAYRVMEIERHLHSYSRWYGLAASPSGETHRADTAGAAAGVFQIDAGSSAWGAWLQILGSSDTPATAGNVYFDLHQLLITAAEKSFPYVMQVAFGETAAGALTAGTYTETMFAPASNLVDAGPVELHSRRHAVGTKVWARCICPGQATATLDFYFGMHEYEG